MRVVLAPAEGEAQAVAEAQDGVVDFALITSNDSDALIYLALRPDLPASIVLCGEEHAANEFHGRIINTNIFTRCIEWGKRRIDLSTWQPIYFALLAALAGCDYHKIKLWALVKATDHINKSLHLRCALRIAEAVYPGQPILWLSIVDAVLAFALHPVFRHDGATPTSFCCLPAGGPLQPIVQQFLQEVTSRLPTSVALRLMQAFPTNTADQAAAVLYTHMNCCTIPLLCERRAQALSHIPRELHSFCSKETSASLNFTLASTFPDHHLPVMQLHLLFRSSDFRPVIQHGLQRATELYMYRTPAELGLAVVFPSPHAHPLYLLVTANVMRSFDKGVVRPMFLCKLSQDKTSIVEILWMTCECPLHNGNDCRHRLALLFLWWLTYTESSKTQQKCAWIERAKSRMQAVTAAGPQLFSELKRPHLPTMEELFAEDEDGSDTEDLPPTDTHPSKRRRRGEDSVLSLAAKLRARADVLRGSNPTLLVNKDAARDLMAKFADVLKTSSVLRSFFKLVVQS